MVFRKCIEDTFQIPHSSYPSHWQFYPLLEHEHSEERYEVSDFLVSCMISYTNKLDLHNYWYDYLIHKYPLPNSLPHFSFQRQIRIPLLVRCYCPLIWPSELPLNLNYILVVILILTHSEPALYILLTFDDTISCSYSIALIDCSRNPSWMSGKVK
jgi:hypothetical protein